MISVTIAYFKVRTRHSCRVCGMRFMPSRRDQITCSSTCRQRLRRGGAFAYLADLSPRERVRERRDHAALDRDLADLRQEDRTLRAEARQRRQQRREAKRRDQLALVLGRVQLQQQEQQQERQHRHLLMSVAGGVALLAKQAGEITPAAIAAFLDDPLRFPEDEIASALAEMRASGEYEDEVARGVAMRGDANTDMD
jgi:hypothetical protein